MKKMFILCAALFSVSAFAGSDLDKQAYQISLSNGSISEQRLVVDQKLKQIDYVELTSANQKLLNEQFTKLESMTAGDSKASDSVSTINDILAKTFKDSKISCTFEKPLGSNTPKRTCMTMAAKKRIYDDSQRDLRLKYTSDVQRVDNN